MTKITQACFIAFAFLFSVSSFAQQNTKTSLVAANESTYASADNKSTDDQVVEAYIIEETTNMKFGKSVTKYKVSNLDLIKNHDLGPNNTRTITPLYKKVKPKRAVATKTVKDSSAIANKPLKEVAPSVARSK